MEDFIKKKYKVHKQDPFQMNEICAKESFADIAWRDAKKSMLYHDEGNLRGHC